MLLLIGHAHGYFILDVLQYAYMATVEEVIKYILHVVLTGEVKVGAVHTIKRRAQDLGAQQQYLHLYVCICAVECVQRAGR